MKLSKPQMKLLAELPRRLVNTYPPAVKLVELGLAEWKKTPATWDNDFLERTPEGDKVLALESMKGLEK